MPSGLLLELCFGARKEPDECRGKHEEHDAQPDQDFLETVELARRVRQRRKERLIFPPGLLAAVGGVQQRSGLLGGVSTLNA